MEGASEGTFMVKVRNPHGKKLPFRVKGSTLVKKIMTGYCAKYTLRTVELLFNNSVLRPSDTVSQAQLLDGSVITTQNEESLAPVGLLIWITFISSFVFVTGRCSGRFARRCRFCGGSERT